MHLQPEVFGLRFPEHLTHGGGKCATKCYSLSREGSLALMQRHLLNGDFTGFPIHLKNNSSGPVGAILVSGLPSEEDHKVSDMIMRYRGPPLTSARCLPCSTCLFAVYRKRAFRPYSFTCFTL